MTSITPSNTSVKSVTPWYHSLAMGFCIGVTEVSINHPLWVIKTRLQAKWGMTLDPRLLYRGFTLHAISSVPIDTIQITFSRIVQERWLPDDWNSSIKRSVAGFIGGVISSAVAGPTEMIMTRQQTVKTIREATRHILKEGGPRRLLTGLITTVMREGPFSAAFYAGMPILKHELTKRKMHELPASIVASVLVGIPTTIITHPFDTVKTIMQTSQKPTRFVQSFKNVYSQAGLKGYFDGLTARMARVSLSIFIVGTMNQSLEQRFLGVKDELS